MIITRLIGGLGNQLFQYALGYSLSKKNNTILKLDITGFETYKLHKFSLDAFAIEKNFASKEEINLFKNNFHRLFLPRKFLNFFNKSNNKIILEKGNTFDVEILECKDNIYLDGYWQSEKYFYNFQQPLRQNLIIKKTLIDENLKVANKIIEANSISLHIRRADYISNSATNSFHGTCSLDYYTKAVNYICQRISNPTFYIFSDDIEWVKKNININYPILYVNHNNADTNYEDMRLMSLCKHNIIANSTFSWWGAWLNNNPNKIIIASKKWFNDEHINTKDLIPENWIRL